MKKIKNIFFVLIMGVISMMPFIKTNAKEPVNVYIFYGSTCPYCEAAMEYFDSLEEEYGDMFDVVGYEVWNDANNAELMESVAAQFKEAIDGVPYIVIGEKTFQGYASSFDDQILEAIKTAYNEESRYDVMEYVEGNSGTSVAVYITLGVIVISIVSLLAFSKAKAN